MYKPVFCILKLISWYLLITAFLVQQVKAHDSLLYPTRSCRNPNGVWGECMPLHYCPSLQSILSYSLTDSYRFLRYSSCQVLGHDSLLPHFCCTSDIQFHVKDAITFPEDSYQLLTTSKPAQRPNTYGHRQIVYPGRYAKIDRDRYYGTTRAPTTTTDFSETTLLPATAHADRFPKPPHCGAVTISNKIYGGEEAELTEFSWMVNLEYRAASDQTVSLCAGSLINEHYVLTAAHCVRGKIEEKYGKVVSVRLGDHDTGSDVDCRSESCLEPYQRVGIERVVVHEGFDHDHNAGIYHHHDIALIRLDREIKFSDFIEPVCLPAIDDDAENGEELLAGQQLMAAGWGHNGTVKATREKRKVYLPFVEHSACRKRFAASRLFIADEQLCAGGEYKKDTCSGDSGGPLMRLHNGNWILEGIVSFGRGCGLEKPAIYTNVRKYLHWIEQHAV